MAQHLHAHAGKAGELANTKHAFDSPTVAGSKLRPYEERTDRGADPSPARRHPGYAARGDRGRGTWRRSALHLGSLLSVVRAAGRRALRVLDAARGLGGGDLAYRAGS